MISVLSKTNTYGKELPEKCIIKEICESVVISAFAKQLQLPHTQ